MKTLTQTQLHRLPGLLVSLLVLALGVSSAFATYPDPPGGWTYKYQGNQLIVGAENSGQTSLDGFWTHDNGSDAWDGSTIGGTFSTGGFGVGNGPGGTILLTNAGVEFLRLQDTGDPRDYGYPDQSCRKIYFGHSIDADTAAAPTIMRDGVTLTFRARVPTLAKAGPPLDPLHRDGQQAGGTLPYPAAGDGYVTSDGGKGNFVIREGGNGADIPPAAIAFSFTCTNDTTGGAPTPIAGFAGLTFNEFNGNTPSSSVNFGQGTKTNLVPFDPTEWHELYIVIRDDPADIGTHEAFIFLDDGLIPYVFKITGGTGADMSASFLAMGGSATPQNWALDVDWFGYKDEAIFPPGALLPPSLFGFAPVNRTTFHPAASNLTFSVSALMPTNTLPAAGIKVFLNGQDVSGQLTLTGSDTSQSRKITYGLLQPNTDYAATYIVTDSGGLSTTNDLTFDTFVESASMIFEAEDYNYGSGNYIADPAPGAYAANPGNAGIDFQDATPTGFGAFRSDAVDMTATADAPRAKFVSAAQTDYDITGIGRGEWWNYTGSLTSSTYAVWIRGASTAAQGVQLDQVTGDTTQPNQTVRFLGAFQMPQRGALNQYSYVQLKDVQGRPIAIPGGGLRTLRVTAPQANNNLVFNYLLLQAAPANSGAPLVSVLPGPGATGVPGDAAIEAVIYDGGTSVGQGSVKLKVGGQEVAAVVAKSGGITTVRYAPATLWSPGVTYALSLVYNDGADHAFDWSITAANYAVLTPAMKVTNATVPGFVWRIHQNEANQDATIQKALNAMSGALGLPNLADPNAQGPAAAPGTPASPGNGVMTFQIPTVINLGQDTAGNFGTFTPDEQMPGVPGLNAGMDGIAVEINTFIQLSAGLHTMCVTSDDGFRTTAGFLNDSPLLLDQLDGGRSAADSLFQFGVQEAGVYAFRTLYFEGGGNASIEWTMVNPDGSRSLINDTANGGPAAYQNGTVPSAPAPNVVLNLGVNGSGQLVLTWSSGTLESSGNVAGGYTTVPGATSPYVVNPVNTTNQFYRVKVQ